MSLSKIHKQNLKNILFFSTKQIIFRVGRLNIKIILEIKFYFFYTLRKITVGGFVNQLIKKFWPYCVTHYKTDMNKLVNLNILYNNNKRRAFNMPIQCRKYVKSFLNRKYFHFNFITVDKKGNFSGCLFLHFYKKHIIRDCAQYFGIHHIRKQQGLKSDLYMSQDILLLQASR